MLTPQGGHSTGLRCLSDHTGGDQVSISIVNTLSLDAPEGGVVRQMPYWSTPTVGVTYFIYIIYHISSLLGMSTLALVRVQVRCGVLAQ